MSSPSNIVYVDLNRPILESHTTDDLNDLKVTVLPDDDDSLTFNSDQDNSVETLQETPIANVNFTRKGRATSMSKKVERADEFVVSGPTGQFLGRLEKKPKGSIVITVDAAAGAGKTTAMFKWLNDFAAAGHRGLFASLEEEPHSNLFQDKKDKYLNSHTIKMVDTIGEFKSYKDFANEIKDYDFIITDSWQKLQEMIGKTNLDNDIRKKFDGKVFIFVFQRTSDGKMRGGSANEFDGDIIIKGEKGNNFNENKLYHYKNRYTIVDINDIAYNIAFHGVYNPNDLESLDNLNTDELQVVYI
jgi:hypothetical protein